MKVKFSVALLKVIKLWYKKTISGRVRWEALVDFSWNEP